MSLIKEEKQNSATHEQRLQAILSALQASPNGVVMLDANAQIEWCNQTAAKHLGIHPERDVMQRVGNLMRDPIFTAYMAVEQPTDAVVISGFEHRLERPVRISVQRHRYGEGKQLLLTRDVTLLEQAEAMRRDFVANVSHEIRTPLTVLAGFVDIRHAVDSYRMSYMPGWDRYMAPIPLSLDQLKWWLRFGDHTRPFSLDLVPPEPDMTETDPPVLNRVFWDSAAEPAGGRTLADVLYQIRVHDANEGLLLDSLTMAEIMEDAGTEVMILDALVVEGSRLKPTMAAMQPAPAGAGTVIMLDSLSSLAKPSAMA